ncbi:HhH-GPD-type base excision DNA repair protein [Actinoallomurus sp. NPDC052274]|uniref:HhH-GPD-type base excision DNA repair protein n=1 Tax=Actinoallomurus sp. NPDC052274 TaxID=3155420 RepID=UPI003418484E
MFLRRSYPYSSIAGAAPERRRATRSRTVTSPAPGPQRRRRDPGDRFGEHDRDPDELARYDPDALVAVVAGSVQALSRAVLERYDGAAERVWTEAATGRDLLARVGGLPGFGDQKARIFVALLGKRLGVRLKGWRAAAGHYGDEGAYRSVADIVDEESLGRVRAYKQEMKAAAKARALRDVTHFHGGPRFTKLVKPGNAPRRRRAFGTAPAYRSAPRPGDTGLAEIGDVARPMAIGPYHHASRRIRGLVPSARRVTGGRARAVTGITLPPGLPSAPKHRDDENLTPSGVVMEAGALACSHSPIVMRKCLAVGPSARRRCRR